MSVDDKRSNPTDKNVGQGKGRLRGGTRGLQGLRHRKKTCGVDFTIPKIVVI